MNISHIHDSLCLVGCGFRPPPDRRWCRRAGCCRLWDTAAMDPGNVLQYRTAETWKWSSMREKVKLIQVPRNKEGRNIIPNPLVQIIQSRSEVFRVKLAGVIQFVGNLLPQDLHLTHLWKNQSFSAYAKSNRHNGWKTNVQKESKTFMMASR